MKISQKRQVDRFNRGVEFMQKHGKDFSPESEALKTASQLKDVLASAETNLSEGNATKPGRRVYRSDKLVALNTLRAELDRISRTAALVAARDESFDNTFQMPDKRRKDELAKSARHFIEQFPKVSAKFKAFEMDESNVQQLKSALEDYEQVQATPAEKPDRPTRTPASPNPTLAEGIALMNALDVIIGNKYRENSEIMENWKEVSALEVTHRKRKTKDASKDA